jgi:hypothetical protein
VLEWGRTSRGFPAGGSISTLRRPDLVRDQLLANRSSSCEEEEEEVANPATLVKETKPQETRIPSSSAAPPRLIRHPTTPKPPPRNLQQQEEITNLTAASPSHNSLDAALEAASLFRGRIWGEFATDFSTKHPLESTRCREPAQSYRRDVQSEMQRSAGIVSAAVGDKRRRVRLSMPAVSSLLSLAPHRILHTGIIHCIVRPYLYHIRWYRNTCSLKFFF